MKFNFKFYFWACRISFQFQFNFILPFIFYVFFNVIFPFLYIPLMSETLTRVECCSLFCFYATKKCMFYNYIYFVFKIKLSWCIRNCIAEQEKNIKTKKYVKKRLHNKISKMYSAFIMREQSLKLFPILFKFIFYYILLLLASIKIIINK